MTKKILPESGPADKRRSNGGPPQALNILLVEDVDDDALLLAHELRSQGIEANLQRVSTFDAFNAALHEGEWDIVVADYMLPDFTGLDALRLIQDRGIDLPFIVVSGRLGEEAAVQMMKLGAHDYITKDNISRLTSAIKREVWHAGNRRLKREAGDGYPAEKLSVGEPIGGLLLLDRENKITFSNSLADGWFGSGRTLVGKSFAQVFSEGGPYLEQSASRAFQTGQPSITDTFVHEVGHDSLCFYLAATPVETQNGEIDHLKIDVINFTKTRPVRVLLVEDLEDDAILLIHELHSAGIEVHHRRVETLDAMNRALDEEEWDVVIADYMLPRFTGLDALRLVQKRGVDLPFIVVSGRLGEEAAVEIMRLGADDYITKNNMSRLAPAIHRGIREAVIRRHSRRAEEHWSNERRRLTDVINHSNCGLLLIDPGTTVTYSNPIADRWFGAGKTLLGKHLTEVFRCENRSEIEREVSDVFHTGKSTITDAFPQIVDRSLKYFYLAATPVRTKGDNIEQLTIVIVDFTETKRTRDLGDSLSLINQMITGAQDISSILEQILKEAAGAVGARGAGIKMVDDRVQRPDHLFGTAGRLNDAPLPRPAQAAGIEDEGSAQIVCGANRLVRRLATRIARHIDTDSLLAAGLTREQMILGAIFFCDPTPGVSFDEHHLDFAQKLASTVSLAIEKSRLHDETTKQLARTELLKDIASAMVERLDLISVADTIFDSLRSRIGLRSGSIYTKDDKAHGMRLLSAAGIPHGARKKKACLSLNANSIIVRAFLTDATLTHLDDNVTPERAELLGEMGVSAHRYAAVPIRHRGHALGSMFFSFDEQRPFSLGELELFNSIADLAAQAVENARRLEAETAARKEAASELEISNLLLQASEIIGHPLDPQETAASLVGIVTQLTEHSRASITLISQETNQGVLTSQVGLKRERGGSPEVIDFADVPAEIFDAIQNSKSMVMDFDEMGSISPEVSTWAQQFSVRLALVTPLLIQKELMGYIGVDEPNERVPFAEREIRLVEGLAPMAAAAIKSSQAFQAQRNVAETLQQGLLRISPTFSGIEYGTTYRSATESAQIGGDFYDIFGLGEKHICFLIGDIMGKGIKAAAQTAAIKGMIKSHAHTGLDPAAILRIVNTTLCGSELESDFATLFVAVLHTPSGVFRYCNGGHPSPIIRRDDGSITELKGRSPLVGAFAWAEYSDASGQLSPGDCLVLFTDGATEARGKAGFFGEEGVRQSIMKLQFTATAEIPGALYHEIVGFSGGVLQDDLAIVGISLQDSTEDADLSKQD